MKNHNHQKKIETLNTRWHFHKKDKSNPKKETNKAKESENKRTREEEFGSYSIKAKLSNEVERDRFLGLLTIL
jgi:hypothetical protein